MNQENQKNQTKSEKSENSNTVIREIFSSWKVKALAILVIVSLAHIFINGIKWGIDFVGGVRIPITLEKKVDKETMDELILKIKNRVSGFGLTQVKVKAIGNDLIYLELPAGNEKEISLVERLVTQQGVFVGIVNGKLAISGNSIVQNTIMPVSTNELSHSKADWGVRLSLDSKGNLQFAQAVKGEANKQIYMFLDRPNNFLIIIPDDFFKNYSMQKNLLIMALHDSIKYENDNSSFVSESEFNITEYLNSSYMLLIIDKKMESYLKSDLDRFNVSYKVVDSTKPELVYIPQLNNMFVSEWKAIGLLTSLTLSPEVTTGTPSATGYVISGTVNATNVYEKNKLANEKTKEIINILKSGSLPVKVTIGNKKLIPAPLGQRFLEYSVIALALAILFISLLVSIRYRKVSIIVPVLIISFCEIIILIAILGTFTIDLATIAGIIAAIGVSVDAQIVITDELLKRIQNRTIEEKLKRAYEIITINVVVAIMAMLPLLFSGITEIIGFAVATILGSLLGILLSRPAYSQIAKYLVKEEVTI
ncbi:MAG: hypothetical protein N3E37_04170 [Candidatus Micrarchaeota archaeon]|nr:hypothetical protein [Candidatus Micrarchaeota archaeon]